MSARGYFAVGVINGKTEKNLGTLWRTAHLYDAAFIFTVGARYKRQASDTPNTRVHTPMFEFQTFDDLVSHLPYSTPLIGVELDPRATAMQDFTHPLRGCYLLGAEDHGLSPRILDRCHALVQIPTVRSGSMNVATAGALLMHDRYSKSAARQGALR